MASESNQHLYQACRYSDGQGWSTDFLDVASKQPSLSWDAASFLSFVTYGFVCGDRTFVNEVKRQPWMSAVERDLISEAPVTQHGFARQTSTEIATTLLAKLEDEAVRAVVGYSRVIVLTSGGLDSRMIAGVIKRLKDSGRIKQEVLAVTWGQSGSRDVEIGRVVAEKLGFQWKHLELNRTHLAENIEAVADRLGALVSPIHLHRMPWFCDTNDEKNIVLAGSYGDSVGRAEFSGRTVLELLPLQFQNTYGLLRPAFAAEGQAALAAELERYRKRFNARPEYARRECEQQCHYMRGLISHAMSIINFRSSTYQMFSSPEVYGYVWNVHPAYRTNKPYSRLLELLGHDLDRLPWARTNKPLGRRPGISVKARFKGYHDYGRWADEILTEIDLSDHLDWAAATGVFDPDSIRDAARRLSETSSKEHRQISSGHLMWILSLRRLADKLTVRAARTGGAQPSKSTPVSAKTVSPIRRALREIPVVLKSIRAARKWLLRQRSLREFPPA